MLYGFRDDEWTLLGTESFAVTEMPQQARQRSAAMFQQPWEDNVCLNFLHAVLDWLREEVQDDEPRALCYGGRWRPAPGAPPLLPGAIRWAGELATHEGRLIQLKVILC